MNNSNLKTLEALKRKANDEGRMPSLKRIKSLLDSLSIDSNLEVWSEMKYTKGRGMTYTTGGGKKLYEGYRMIVYEINLNFSTTETYYSCNTFNYARQIVKLIESKL